MDVIFLDKGNWYANINTIVYAVHKQFFRNISSDSFASYFLENLGKNISGTIFKSVADQILYFFMMSCYILQKSCKHNPWNIIIFENMNRMLQNHLLFVIITYYLIIHYNYVYHIRCFLSDFAYYNKVYNCINYISTRQIK